MIYTDVSYIPSQESWLVQSEAPAPVPSQEVVKLAPSAELYPSSHVTVKSAPPVLPVADAMSLLATVSTGHDTARRATYQTYMHQAKDGHYMSINKRIWSSSRSK